MPSRLSRAPVTTALLITISIIFLLQLAFPGITDAGANTSMIFLTREYWRLLTAMFLHGGVLHWLLNSWTLFQLGSLYEEMFGSARFTAVYFITGICASVVSMMHLPPGIPSVGASGAIFGVLGAFFFSIRRSPRWRNDKWARGLLGQLVFWAVANIALGLRIEIVDNWGHIGGLVAGLILGLLPHRVPPPPPRESVIDIQPSE